MRRQLMMGLLLLCCAGPLTACQDTKVITKLADLPRDQPPANLQTCQDAPDKAAGDATQKTVALMVAEYDEALADCKRKLAALWKVVTE